MSSIVAVTAIPNPCAGPASDAYGTEHDGFNDAWVGRMGTVDYESGTVAPYAVTPEVQWGFLRRSPLEISLLEHEYNSYTDAIESGQGLRRVVPRADRHNALELFAVIPNALSVQRDRVQCLRDREAGVTTRFDHEIQSGRIGALIGIRAGLSTRDIDLMFAACVMHDVGHLPLSHSSEIAANMFMKEHFPDLVVGYDHTIAGGVLVENLGWHKDLIHPVGNHSWHLLEAQSVQAGIPGAADRISYLASDLIDCLRVGRIAFEELPALAPRVMALLPIDFVTLSRMENRNDVLQGMLVDVLATDVARQIREGGVVGFGFEYAAAVNELRNVNSQRLFKERKQKRWEQNGVEFVKASLDTLLSRELAQSRRELRLLAEDQAMRVATDRVLARYATWSDSVAIEFGRNNAKVRPGLAATLVRSPRVTPKRAVGDGSFTKTPYRAKLMTLTQVFGGVAPLDMGQGRAHVNVTVEQAMNILSLLKKDTESPLEMQIWPIDESGCVPYTIPPNLPRRKTAANRAARELVSEQLTEALGRVVTNGFEMLDALESSSHVDRDSPLYRSLDALREFAVRDEEGTIDAFATMDSYCRVYHESRHPDTYPNVIPVTEVFSTRPSIALELSI